MKKEQERANLHRVIWKIAEDVRGSVDGWDFKSYVLGFLFYRFICENLCAYVATRGIKDYASLDEDTAMRGRDEIIRAKGFFISPKDLFKTIQTNACGGGGRIRKPQSVPFYRL